MIAAYREKFNQEFSEDKYKTFLDDLNQKHPGDIVFRIAETPIFIPAAFTHKMLSACESIVDIITSPGFKKMTQGAIPAGKNVPGDEGRPDFLVFDFGICKNEKGDLEPQLIEMQGFPSLFAFQVYYPTVLENHFNISKNLTPYLNGYKEDTYTQLMNDIILNGHPQENVILLEIKPQEQKTRIDFYCTTDYAGIPVICLTELVQEGDKLFYEKDGRKIQVKRIYNRIIFDELDQVLPSLGKVVDITQRLDVEWAPHPNWFYRISKYTIPFIKNPFVPETLFLNELTEMPLNLEDYVLKPLFSFAGQGVVIDIKKEDIQNIKDPENWILQKKVVYADVIKTPNVPAKAEIRIFYFWGKNAERPVAVGNLARMSKGKMIGVRYNMDKDWVGASIAYFEK